MEILTNNNTKLKKTSKKYNANIYAFDLPAYKTKTGQITCPFADDCIKYCYASKGAYTWLPAQNKHNLNYKLSQQENFTELIQNDIDSKRKKITHIRLHSAGDFYSVKYLLKWLEIADKNPDIVFYAYTKSIPFFKNSKLIKLMLRHKQNFKVIFSYGSKKDNLINSIDRHAKIFNNESELKKAGYINASEYDLIAINSTNKKIGLIYH